MNEIPTICQGNSPSRRRQILRSGKHVAIKCMKNTFDSIDQVNNLREIQARNRGQHCWRQFVSQMTRKNDTDTNAKTKCTLADFCLLHVSLAVVFRTAVIPDGVSGLLIFLSFG